MGNVIDVIAVFKIRSETCRTEAQFCENLYMIKKESLPNLAGPTQILPVNVRGPALILKTVIVVSGKECVCDWGWRVIILNVDTDRLCNTDIVTGGPVNT